MQIAEVLVLYVGLDNEMEVKMDEGSRKYFFGTYFDRDIVLKITRLGEIFSWIVAVVYVFDFITALVVFLLQYLRGSFISMGPTDWMTSLLYIFERPFRGVVYFVVLQAVSKTLMILMDIEENTRRIKIESSVNQSSKEHSRGKAL